VHGDLLDKTGQDRAKASEVANALSPDLQYYRISLIPSLLEKVHPNVKAGYNEFALFELGKGHSLDDMQKDGLPAEFEFTALIVTANDKLKKPGAAYYQAKAYLETLTGAELTFKPVNKDMQKYPVVKPYDMNRSALVSFKDGDFLGIIGEFRPSVARAFKLPKFTAGFEIDTTVLQRQTTAYTPLLRFPGVKQDITLKVAADLAYEELADFMRQTVADKAPDEAQTAVEPADIYQKAGDEQHRQITFHITVTHPDRTLTDKAVTVVLDEVAAAVQAKFKAERI
jgi:phenylalanyl-tRNA synthetase beta chain